VTHADQWAVIFKSKQAMIDEEFQRHSDELDRLVINQPGFLRMDSVHDQQGFGITVSYWSSLEAIKAFKALPLHLSAQAKGRQRWFDSYTVEIAKIERAYHFDRADS